MRNLLLSSCFLLMIGCGTPPYAFLQPGTPQPDCISSLLPKIGTVLYNAQINVTGKHLSGLLIFKSMNDKSIRAVFTSETGLTFFDFEYSGNKFNVIYCIDKLNKKPVINQLKKDIGLLIRFNKQHTPEITGTGNHELYFGYPEPNETTWYITDSTCNEIKRIETASAKKKKVIVKLTGYGTVMPDSVYLEHQAFEFNISLQKIEQ